jgi:hypothetical protein
VLERLTVLLAGPARPPGELRPLLESTANEISDLSDLPSPLRGDARARVSGRLAELDAAIVQAARAHAAVGLVEALRREAEEQLAPFRDRMPQEAYDHAVDHAIDRLLRDHAHLPLIAFE